MANRTEYSNRCPGCEADGVAGTLGFDFDAGRIMCTNQKHGYDELPGEQPPQLDDDLQPMEATGPEAEAANNFEAENAPAISRSETAVSIPPADESARLGAILAERESSAPRTTLEAVAGAAGPVVSEATKPILGGVETAPGPVLEPIVSEVDPAQLAEQVRAGVMVPLVPLGACVALPGGDVLIGLRIAEAWIGPLQSEAEDRGITLAEIIQERVTAGMFEWYSSPAPAR